MLTESRPPETVSEPEIAVPEALVSVEAGPPASETHALVTDTHTPSVHDVLLETVSADALEAGAGQHGPEGLAQEAPLQEAPPEETPAESAGTGEAVAEEAEPAPVMQPPEALEAAPQEDLTPAADTASEVARPAEAVPEPSPVAAVAFVPDAMVFAPTPEAIRRATSVQFDMIGEITEVNATILDFLRSEGSAAVAHWQSLSSARTPADAIRIQVDEMQRAADASLTCFNALARRAGRLAAGIGRA